MSWLDQQFTERPGGLVEDLVREELSQLAGSPEHVATVALFWVEMLPYITLDFGHAVTEAVLAETSRLLRSALPDAAVRWVGSGEFLAVWSSTEPCYAAQGSSRSLLRRALDAIAAPWDPAPPSDDGARFKVSAVALAACASGPDRDGLLYEWARAELAPGLERTDLGLSSYRLRDLCHPRWPAEPHGSPR